MAYYLTDAAKTAFQNGPHTATITITLTSGSAPSGFAMDTNGVLTDSFSLDTNGILSADDGLSVDSGGILSLSGGSTLTVTEANIRQGGLVIDRRSVPGEHIVMGAAMASEMTLVLDNTTGAYDGIDFIGAEANVVIGATYNGSAYTCPMGIFVIDSYTRRQGALTLTGLDYMTKLDRAFDSSGLSNTATIWDFISYLCSLCGVTWANAYTGTGSRVRVLDLSTTYSCRQYLSWALQCLGGIGYIDWNGELRTAHYITDFYGVALDRSKMFSFSPSPFRIAWDEAAYQRTNETSSAAFWPEQHTTYAEYTSDTLSFTYPVLGNQLVIAPYVDNGYSAPIPYEAEYFPRGAVLPSAAAPYIYTGYIAFEAEAVACPWLWPGDGVGFYGDASDASTLENCSTLTSIVFTLNGRTRLACGETAKDPFDTANGEYSFNDQTAFSPTQDATINSKLVPYLPIEPDAATAAAARANLGLGNTTGPVPVANGGTGATTAAGALAAIGAAPALQEKTVTATTNSYGNVTTLGLVHASTVILGCLCAGYMATPYQSSGTAWGVHITDFTGAPVANTNVTVTAVYMTR